MGGVVATFLAGLLDQRVAGFINIEGNISASDCTFSALIAACDPEEFAATGFARLCETVKRDGEYDRALALYAQSLRLAEPGQLYLNATELVAMSAAETLATAMGALTMPKTYLLGSPGGSGARTRELLALADVAWSAVPNAGHWPFIDQTDLCAAEIGGFLQRLEV
jgi:pimeloyl-ACP methyl ester carboxylesterase